MAQLEGMLPPATGSKENNEYWWTIDPQSLVLVRIASLRGTGNWHLFRTVQLMQLAEHDSA